MLSQVKINFKSLIKGKQFIKAEKNSQILWEIKKKYNRKTFIDNKANYNRPIDVYIKSIGRYHTEYLVNFNYLVTIMKEYGFELVSSKMFEEEVKTMNKNKNKFIKIINNMSEDEKQFSYLNRYFIFTKIREPVQKLYNNLIKKIKKFEDKIK